MPRNDSSEDLCHLAIAALLIHKGSHLDLNTIDKVNRIISSAQDSPISSPFREDRGLPLSYHTEKRGERMDMASTERNARQAMEETKNEDGILNISWRLLDKAKLLSPSLHSLSHLSKLESMSVGTALIRIYERPEAGMRHGRADTGCIIIRAGMYDAVKILGHCDDFMAGCLLTVHLSNSWTFFLKIGRKLALQKLKSGTGGATRVAALSNIWTFYTPKKDRATPRPRSNHHSYPRSDDLHWKSIRWSIPPPLPLPTWIFR